jgi:periplasmic protein TonB
MEMTYDNGPGEVRGWRRLIKPSVALLVLLGIAAVLWHFAHDTAGIQRETVPDVTTIIPLPPAPPPPKQKPPPEKIREVVHTPVERPVFSPRPTEVPKPNDNQPRQMTMDAPAQAGTDGFNIGAGDGGGMLGSGGGGQFGNASYAQYMVYTLQRAIENDKRVQDAGGLRFAGNINLWMEPNGRITKVTLAKSTGDETLDAAVIGAVQTLGKVDEPPPPAATFPVLVKLQGHQAG